MRIFPTVLLFLFTAISSADDLIDFEISANQMSSYYRAYIFFDGDKKYSKPLLEITSKASVYDAILKGKPQLLKQWHQLNELVHTVLADETNIRNVNTQAHWEVMSGTLNRTLEEEVKDDLYNKQFEDPKSNNYLRLLLLRMEKTLAVYMALTNPVGGLGISAESPDLDNKVLEISNMLTLMNPQDPALKRVEKKWNFVKKILLKYNTNTAPYIVLHSYEKIRLDVNTHLATL